MSRSKVTGTTPYYSHYETSTAGLQRHTPDRHYLVGPRPWTPTLSLHTTTDPPHHHYNTGSDRQMLTSYTDESLMSE